MMKLTKDEEKLIDECIASHLRMIAMHRKSIQNLTLKKYKQSDCVIEPFDLKIIKGSEK